MDGNGLPVTNENRVARTITVNVHDSKKEVADMARRFLLDFSDSTIQDVNYILRNFSDVGFCADKKAAEFDDITRNRRERRIVASRVDPPTVTVNFGGSLRSLDESCSERTRRRVRARERGMAGRVVG